MNVAKMYNCPDCGNDIASAPTDGRQVEVLAKPTLVYAGLAGSSVWIEGHQTHAAVCAVHYARLCRMGRKGPRIAQDGQTGSGTGQVPSRGAGRANGDSTGLSADQVVITPIREIERNGTKAGQEKSK